MQKSVSKALETLWWLIQTHADWILIKERHASVFEDSGSLLNPFG